MIINSQWIKRSVGRIINKVEELPIRSVKLQMVENFDSNSNSGKSIKQSINFNRRAQISQLKVFLFKLMIPQAQASTLRVGDWVCLMCGNLNYSFRLNCNRCHQQTKQNNYYQNIVIAQENSIQHSQQQQLIPPLQYNLLQPINYSYIQCYPHQQLNLISQCQQHQLVIQNLPSLTIKNQQQVNGQQQNYNENTSNKENNCPQLQNQHPICQSQFRCKNESTFANQERSLKQQNSQQLSNQNTLKPQVEFFATSQQENSGTRGFQHKLYVTPQKNKINLLRENQCSNNCNSSNNKNNSMSPSMDFENIVDRFRNLFSSTEKKNSSLNKDKGEYEVGESEATQQGLNQIIEYSENKHQKVNETFEIRRQALFKQN